MPHQLCLRFSFLRRYSLNFLTGILPIRSRFSSSASFLRCSICAHSPGVLYLIFSPPVLTLCLSVSALSWILISFFCDRLQQRNNRVELCNDRLCIFPYTTRHFQCSFHRFCLKGYIILIIAAAKSIINLILHSAFLSAAYYQIDTTSEFFPAPPYYQIETDIQDIAMYIV